MDFNSILKKSHVRNHPLIAGAAQNQRRMRNALRKHAADLEEDSEEKPDLNDIFSQASANKEVDDKNVESFVRASIRAASDALAQFDFPLLPQLSFQRVRDAKYSSVNSKEMISGLVVLSCRIPTVTGALRQAEIPVSIVNGSVVPPSILIHDGTMSVLAQSAVDAIVQRATSYELAQPRGMFSPPLSKSEREMAFAYRNELGWQPREFNRPGMSNTRHSRKQGIGIKEVEQKILQSNEENGTTFEVQGAYGQWELWANGDRLEAGSAKDVYNAWIKYRFNEKYTKPEVLEEFYSDQREGPKQARKQGSEKGVPRAYALVVEDMQKAKDDGTDTFPHLYSYLEHNYILKRIPTCDKDKWEVPLINDGWAINPWERGRRRRGSKEAEVEFFGGDKTGMFGTENDTDKWAILVDGYFELFNTEEEASKMWEALGLNVRYAEDTLFGSFDILKPGFVPTYINDWVPPSGIDKLSGKKETNLLDYKKYSEDRLDSLSSVRSPDEPYENNFDFSILFEPIKKDKEAQAEPDEDYNLIEPKTYSGTRMPIEIDDTVKFEGTDGPIRGSISEVSDDEDWVIVRAKGIEYRVHFEDVQPLNNTYKRKWTAKMGMMSEKELRKQWDMEQERKRRDRDFGEEDEGGVDEEESFRDFVDTYGDMKYHEWVDEGSPKRRGPN